MKKTKGFTLVELVIVIVIVGILSVVAVPIYRGYTRKAMATEGKALLGTIQTSEKVYFAEFASFKGVSETSFDSELDVDARANKYFTSFTISAGSGTGDTAAYTASTGGNGGASGIGLTLYASSKGAPTFAETGLNN